MCDPRSKTKLTRELLGVENKGLQKKVEEARLGARKNL